MVYSLIVSSPVDLMVYVLVLKHAQEGVCTSNFCWPYSLPYQSMNYVSINAFRMSCLTYVILESPGFNVSCPGLHTCWWDTLFDLLPNSHINKKRKDLHSKITHLSETVKVSGAGPMASGFWIGCLPDEGPSGFRIRGQWQNPKKPKNPKHLLRKWAKPSRKLKQTKKTWLCRKMPGSRPAGRGRHLATKSGFFGFFEFSRRFRSLMVEVLWVFWFLWVWQAQASCDKGRFFRFFWVSSKVLLTYGGGTLGFLVSLGFVIGFRSSAWRPYLCKTLRLQHLCNPSTLAQIPTARES